VIARGLVDVVVNVMEPGGGRAGDRSPPAPRPAGTMVSHDSGPPCC